MVIYLAQWSLKFMLVASLLCVFWKPLGIIRIWRSVSEKATLWRNIYIVSYANYYKVSQVEKV